MKYLENSEEITGYRVKIWEREAFKVTGYTQIISPVSRADATPNFWNEVDTDGRLDKLAKASSIRPWILGLGSWDEECEPIPQGHRYTICIEETEHTDFSRLSKEYALYTKELAAVEWMCFEMTMKQYEQRFWDDDPYKMIPKLGYQFCGDVGVHFEAYPPDFERVEFWISVMIPKVAVVNCKVEREQTELLLKYDGTPDCGEAHSVFADSKSSDYRCLGYGSCAKACKAIAIMMNANGLPMIDKDKCIACGTCVKTCPRGIITLIPKTQELLLS